MTDLFKEIIPAILQTKKAELDDEKDYVPYVVNKALSFHYDCIAYANQMNMYPNLDNSMQFHYMINSVRAWKRPFQKWQKLEKDENLELVKEYYGYSNDKAKAALELLTEDQIVMIKKKLYKGGINDKSKRFSRGEAD